MLALHVVIRVLGILSVWRRGAFDQRDVGKFQYSVNASSG